MNFPRIALLLAGLAFFSAGCASLSKPETARLKSQFRKADTNNDGKVSRKEFGYLMVEDAFALFDENKDGVVTLQEYVVRGGTPRAFAEIDRNGNGKVTLEEAKASKVAMDRMTIRFYEADVDKDGYVTLAEALEYRKRVREITRG